VGTDETTVDIVWRAEESEARVPWVERAKIPPGQRTPLNEERDPTQRQKWKRVTSVCTLMLKARQGNETSLWTITTWTSSRRMICVKQAMSLYSGDSQHVTIGSIGTKARSRRMGAWESTAGTLRFPAAKSTKKGTSSY
jgi:hypothetical protein